ncbi:Mss4-like protein [Xylogone sp. PMI_703]|nr:Mss4-like protein [Xylogone sp. PMI_703]
MEEPNVDLVEYKGNCHCGRFKFTVKLPELKSAMQCDCSICSQQGYLWTFPKVSDFIVHTDYPLQEYAFAKKNLIHKFCSNCGTVIFASKSGETSMGLNARAINGINFDSLSLSSYKGSEVEPAYTTPEVPGYRADTVDGELRQYAGSCHCGAVRYTLMNKPITDEKIISCNCSMCSRNGDLWIYPNKSAVTLHGADSLTGYAFLSKDSLRSFCKICGVSVLVNNISPDDTDMPINVRTIHRLNLAELKDRIVKYDGKSKDPQYKVRS